MKRKPPTRFSGPQRSTFDPPLPRFLSRVGRPSIEPDAGSIPPTQILCRLDLMAGMAQHLKVLVLIAPALVDWGNVIQFEPAWVISQRPAPGAAWVVCPYPQPGLLELPAP